MTPASKVKAGVEMFSIYNHEKELQSVEKRINDASYSERDKKLLFDFENDLYIDDLSSTRILKYMGQLNRIREWLGIDFQDATERDVKRIVSYIRRKGLSAATQKDYKITIRKFFRWLYGDENPEIIQWLHVHEKIKDSKLPEEMLTKKEVLEMISVSNQPRDKAFIAALYDTGARLGEIASLKMKHINFDSYGAQIIVNGKTGMRRVRIIFAVPYLSSWLAIHPGRNDPESHVWVAIGPRKQGQPMKYESYRMLLRRAAQKAGIKKRIHPHLFRHSRCTELAQHLTESQLQKHVGWVAGSDMANVYVHLSGKQVDEAILKMYGIEKDEEQEPNIATKTCPKCNTTNEITNGICKKCGIPLDIKKAIEMDEDTNTIASKLAMIIERDPSVKDIFAEIAKRNAE